MKHIFILNPAAGKGNSEKIFLPQVINYLKEAGIDYEIHRSLNKQEIGSYVKQRASMGDAVRFYAIGGDGTICDVLNGMFGFSNAELAVIPCGTGNDFVKNFTNTKNFLDVEKQIKGKSVLIDVLKYNDAYSINMLNIGADCDIVVRSNELKAAGKASGPASYALGALQILTKNPVYKMTYTLDGVEYEDDLLLIAIANGRFCGGGFKSCPKASLTDGLMDVGIIKPCRGPKLMQMLLKYHQGTHLYDKEFPKIGKYLQLKEFDLRPCQSVNVSVDGEVLPFETTHFEVVPNAIRFSIPEGSELINK